MRFVFLLSPYSSFPRLSAYGLGFGSGYHSPNYSYDCYYGQCVRPIAKP